MLVPPVLGIPKTIYQWICNGFNPQFEVLNYNLFNLINQGWRCLAETNSSLTVIEYILDQDLVQRLADYFQWLYQDIELNSHHKVP